jgi:hypothetical protein
MPELKDIQIDQIHEVKKRLFATLNIMFDGIPRELSDFLRDKAILTGGAISSLMHYETPKDYDLYLNDANDIMHFKQYIHGMDKNYIQDSRSTFDFVHCMPWYKISSHTLYISKKQYNAILNKHLIKNEHENAYALSHKRVEKYTAKGWKFP